MLYLEDYLEMIEHLPQELRDRFTDMRELDLTVQNNMDDLEKKVKSLFSECRRNIDTNAATDAHFKSIRNEYYQTLEEADKKVHLANTLYELVDKYLRKLDTELHKFKCELEADNKGITEVLEKRSLELDTPVTTPTLSSQKENRYERYRPRAEKRRDSNATINASYPEKKPTISSNVTTAEPRHLVASTPNVVISNPPAISSNNSSGYIGLMGAGQAIATAATQAIAATQQMQQGRRSMSMKATYEAAISGLPVSELAIEDITGAAQTALQAIQESNKKKQKKAVASTQQQVVQPTIATSAPQSPAVDVQSQEVTEGEWTYDPNEPRYCLCNQVSYGDMVACDNEDCPSEWFHYACVNITAPPKGKWYCPQCLSSMKRRGGRKN